MGKHIRVLLAGLILMWVAGAVATDCTTETALISACTMFVTYGWPDPLPGSPCCNAVLTLKSISDSSGESRRNVCVCIMGLITSNKLYAPTIATLPGFCGVSLGFTIDPTTDCNY
ncbi:hypothetical protein LguiB_003628 [Lonicera macranthoides]